MIHGLAITPPILGRISIGKTIEKNGKRLPQKDDQFTITTQLQGSQGWIVHPLDNQLRQSSTDHATDGKPEKTAQNKQRKKTANAKLRHIPVRLLFNDPDLNLRAEYSLFDRQTGRPVCVGNGVVCNRRNDKGMEQHPCPSPDNCPLGKQGYCKPYGRLYVSIEPDSHHSQSDDQNSENHAPDELAAFIFRTTGFNSIRTLMARMSYFHAVSGGLLAYLPLQLTLRGKSTTQSYRQPVYFVDLTLRDGMSLAQAIELAKQRQVQQVEQGIDQAALDAVAKRGFEQSAFEVNSEEGSEVVAEFYGSDVSVNGQQSEHANQAKVNTNPAQLIHKGVQTTHEPSSLTVQANLKSQLQQSVQPVS